ncbi:MAG: Tad domain-containing protein [Acidimicrobiales bacterium]|nr:Tad domain-containing protein [Acidimicrobiales bacterium]MDG2218149.1 Tad domain-containing protein [Acidimicrobiales bacterium]
MNLLRQLRSMLARVRSKSEGGYAVILTSLLLVPLMGFAGFVVDVGSWYSQASSIQRAADAASLAGVVWQPDFDTAEDAARNAAERNGYIHGVDGITVEVIDTGINQLQVVITDTEVEMYFASLFLDEVQIARSATSEYVKSVPMGSPEHFLGNDPIEGESPNLWLATFGPQTSKRSGDRYHTEVCGGAIFCTGSANEEFDEDGYFFTLNVSAVQAAPLNVELFDVVHHDYGDHCNASFLFADGDVGGEAWYSGNIKGLGDYDEERYEVGGSGNPGGAAWCPGDNGLAGNYEMTVIVREPDNTPFDLEDNPVVCWTRWGANQPSDETDFATDLQDDTGDQPNGSGAAGTGSAPAVDSVVFRDYFREWVNVCSISSPEVGEYVVQIRTNADSSDPTLWDPSISTQGRNRYSMRGGFGAISSPSYGTGVSLSADGRLPMFVNVPPGAPTTCSGSPTCFYVARVTPEYAGQQLQLDVFDLTDGSSINVSFSPPADSGLGTFTACDFIFYDENGSVVDLNESNCTATYAANSQLTNGGSNGDSIAAIIDVPVGYTCNDASAFGCWVTAELTFNGTPSDTTTWSAELTGDPIRLVE